MKFLVEYNNQLIKKMFFYKNCSKETFNYKKFSSNKFLIDKIILQGNFKRKVVTKKKDVLKKNIILQLISNNFCKEIINKKKKINIKLGTITNTLSQVPKENIEYFLEKWYFYFNPFFLENEIISINGPKSIRKDFDSFKSLRLSNSRLISSNFFNFELSLKILFNEEGSSEIFFKNYEC